MSGLKKDWEEYIERIKRCGAGEYGSAHFMCSKYEHWKMLWAAERISELESLITDIHDNLYGEVMGWDDGSDEWEQMRQIAKLVHQRPSVSRKPNE